MGDKELETITSFLAWQGHEYSITNVGNLDLMRKTKGRGGILIYIMNKEVIGLKGLLKLWEEEGLWKI